jgi:DNA-directed RNA polymerase subunit RPC12/RpoP
MRAGEKHRTPPRAGRTQRVTVPLLVTEVTCPSCGAEVDLWNGDNETRCCFCEHRLFRRESTVH